MPRSIPRGWSRRRRIRAWSASARPGSIIITTIRTASGSGRASAAHIAAARETGLPLIVHTRDAEDDTADILADEMGKGAFTGVIHCFTASADFADKALDLGLYISISGIVTFKNAKDLQATAATIPADRLLIETDAPFLAPVPHRGKTVRAGLRRRHRALPRRPARRSSVDELARADGAPTSSRLFDKAARMKRAIILGCGHVVGRAADRQ